MAMLQFGGVLSNTAVRLAQPRITWWLATQQFLVSAASSSNPVILPKKKKAETKNFKENVEVIQEKSKLVKMAFKNLSEFEHFSNVEQQNQRAVPKKFDSTELVNYVLNNVEKSMYSENNVIKSFKILMTWVKNGEVELSEFVSDKRFLNLLNILSETKNHSNSPLLLKSELSDIEMLNLFNNNMNQMDRLIMILIILTKKKYRSVSSLNTISQQIVTSKQILNIKQAADILYCIAVLNFPQEILMKKVCSDLLKLIPTIEKPVMIGSILTSLGLLCYKDPAVLDELSIWATKNWSIMRPQDITTLLLTLATVGYIPKNESELFQNHILLLKKEDMVKLEQWLDIVWALVILDRVTITHISSVLDKSFIDILTGSELLIPKTLKLLNINAVAKLQFKDTYKGPFIEDSNDIQLKLINTKEKLTFIKAVTDPLKTLLPSSVIINTNINTEMGFLLDIECIIDENCGRSLLTNTARRLNEPLKLAIVTQGYHEFTRGQQDLIGLNPLQCKLLELKGYKVMQVPFTEYDIQNKLITRLKYLSQRIVTIVDKFSK